MPSCRDGDVGGGIEGDAVRVVVALGAAGRELEDRWRQEGVDGVSMQLTSLPPLFGYGTCQTLAGFAFGAWHGWLLGVAGCLLGGVTSFLWVLFGLPLDPDELTWWTHAGSCGGCSQSLLLFSRRTTLSELSQPLCEQRDFRSWSSSGAGGAATD